MALPFGSPVDAHANADAVDAPTGYPNCFPTAHGSLTAFGRSKFVDHSATLLSSTSMGIDELWKELEPVEQKISLHNLAVGTGFTGNATGKRGFSVGIDASGWMYRACCLCGSTESPELVVLFARCSRLFRLPFIPVFVFDGPARPRMKRGKIIRGNEHWLTSSFKLMLNGFGFEWIDAPGEAEATLAAMTASGIPLRVDAILTDDSDSFVFGASVVLRIRSEDNANYEASRYSAFDIATMLGLSRDDLVLVAILAGGDYSDGLHGCGLAIAMGLARAGLGKQLISGLEGQSHAGSMVFLAAWRELLRSELQTNASGCLPHRCKRLAASIPADFPDLEVINLYLHPIVVEHTSTRPLILRPPRLDVLARFAEDHFGWGDSVGILAHFADHLFAGLVVRDLVQRALAMDDLLPPLAVPSIIDSIVRERHHKSTGFLAELRLMLDLDPTILISALQSIIGRRDPVQGAEAAVAAWLATDLPKVRVWVPKSMVEYVYPEIVLAYISAQTSKATRTKKTKTQQGKIEAYRPYTAASSSFITTGDPEGHAILRRNEQSGSSSLEVNCSLARPEKRYTAMSVTFRGQEILELITDSEGEY
ncbi:PIN domain-like protein [Mycena olivaceomarginata]|nr:PIN domain-like protein [Mycena olivaceomarginata]KAJ7812116.1 PIN domain-like protein [Mycena olivaceomarginata]KAJ7887487.1 PIN domain-like protein [Mycena olivaceomarginata]